MALVACANELDITRNTVASLHNGSMDVDECVGFEFGSEKRKAGLYVRILPAMSRNTLLESFVSFETQKPMFFLPPCFISSCSSLF